MRIDALLQSATDTLNASSTSARLDAEILLAHALQKNRSYLYTWPEVEPSASQIEAFEAMVAQRLAHYPVAYSIGYQEFWSLTLKVSPDVLIPRSDTELLVETALEKLQSIQTPKILELGTGSGAISLALATERPDASIVATDLSMAALTVAMENQQSLCIDNIRFLRSDWFREIEATGFDLIVSNPPYIDPEDVHLTTSIRYEPLSALTAPEQGLADLATIIQAAKPYLRQTGWLMLEHGYDQGTAVSALLNHQGYENISCLSDLAGNDRINIGQPPSN